MTTPTTQAAQAATFCGRANASIAMLGEFLRNVTVQATNSQEQINSARAQADSTAAAFQQQTIFQGQWFQNLDNSLEETTIGLETQTAYIASLEALNFTVPPGAPTGVVATPGAGRVFLKWDAPWFLGSPMTNLVPSSFIVTKYNSAAPNGVVVKTYADGQQPALISPNVWGVTIDGLTSDPVDPAAIYTFSVTVTSSTDRTSIPSPLSQPVRVNSMCEAPSNVVLTPGAQSIRVDFTPPTTATGVEGFIYTYEIQMGSPMGIMSLSSPTSDTFFVIPGLTNNTPYQIRIRAQAQTSENGSSTLLGEVSEWTEVEETVTPTAVPGAVEFPSAYYPKQTHVLVGFLAPNYASLDPSVPWIIEILDLEENLLVSHSPVISNVKPRSNQKLSVPINTTPGDFVIGNTYQVLIQAQGTGGGGAVVSTTFVFNPTV